MIEKITSSFTKLIKPSELTVERAKFDVYANLSSDGSELGKKFALCRFYKAVPVGLLNDESDELVRCALLQAAGISLLNSGASHRNSRGGQIEVSLFTLKSSSFDDERWLANGFGSRMFNENSSLVSRGVKLWVHDLSYVR